MVPNIVRIQNSWMMDQLRYHKHPHEFNRYYYNLVLAEVFKTLTDNSKNQDLIIFFEDTHFSHAERLPYQKLHSFLSKHFRSVQFTTDNMYDWAQAPDYFTVMDSIPSQLPSMCNKQDSIAPSNRCPDKMFGLHILRPDTHRLGILIELNRAGLLEYFDIRIGFNRVDCTAIEHWRSSNIDLACLEFDISHMELFDLIDSLTCGDRNHLTDNATYIGPELWAKDFEKIKLNDKFAIEVVCDSSIADKIGPFVNEKICIPLMTRQPFLVIGPPNYYSLISKLHGVKTFSDFWNESWDGYTAEFLRDRILDVVATCKDIINRYSPAQVLEVTSDITAHNNQVLYNNLRGNYNVTIESAREMFNNINQEGN